jgi:hypothetical protein
MNDISNPVVGLGRASDLLGIQLRNMQAFSTAQQKMLEGLSMLIKQQAEIMQVLVRRSFGNTLATSSPSDMRGLVGVFIDELKQSIMETQANSNALSEVMMRSVGEVTSTLQARALAALDELKTLGEQVIPTKLPEPFGDRPRLSQELAKAGRPT